MKNEPREAGSFMGDKNELKRELPVSIAIESLEEKIAEIEQKCTRDVAELRHVIEAIRGLKLQEPPTAAESVKPSRNGKPKRNGTLISGAVPISTHVAAAPGGWEQLRLPDAVYMFLQNFTEPIPFGDLVNGLQARGVRLGNPDKPRRFPANVKTTVINNRSRFRYDKKRDTVVLVRAQAEAAAV